MATYIHELADWPKFVWQPDQIAVMLGAAHHQQGLLRGQMEAVGLVDRQSTILQVLTSDVVKSSEIEGERLNRDDVRSSIARRLGIDAGALRAADRNVEGVVEMTLDATQNYASPITAERLFAWHAALFPTGRSGMIPITVGAWRNDEDGPMQVVSGPIGKERVHYQAPSAERLAEEMARLLHWIEKEQVDPLIKAAIAHLWFVTIHPFDDGNGRIARAITDLMLARSENSSLRFYSLSSQIQAEREDYYTTLERTQKGNLDITPWLQWFLRCQDRAIKSTQEELSDIFMRARFWEKFASEEFSERQRKVLNQFLSGFEGHLTSSKWAKLAKCSPDTALRDIEDLLSRGILMKNPGGGRSTSYKLDEALVESLKG